MILSTVVGELEVTLLLIRLVPTSSIQEYLQIGYA